MNVISYCRTPVLLYYNGIMDKEIQKHMIYKWTLQLNSQLEQLEVGSQFLKLIFKDANLSPRIFI